MKKDIQVFNFSNEGINNYLIYIEKILKDFGYDRKQIVAFRLNQENEALELQDHFGPEKEFTVSWFKIFNRINITIKYNGESFDPRLVSQQKEELDEWMLNVISMSDNAPSYKYANGVNKLSVSIKLKDSIGAFTQLLISIGVGILVSVIGLYVSPNILELTNHIFEFVSGIILDLVVFGASLMVFFMVIEDVTSCSSITQLKEMGGTIFVTFAWDYLICGLISILFIFFKFGITLAEGESSGLLDIILNTVKSIIPTSIIEPFLNMDFLQIVILGSAFGVAALVLDQAAEPFINVCQSLLNIVTQIMNWISKLIPMYVFLSIPLFVWSGQLEALAGIWQTILIVVAICAINSIIFVLLIKFTKKISIKKQLKQFMPLFLEGLTTGSSSATLPNIIKGISKFGVPKYFANFSTIVGYIFACSTNFVCQVIIMAYIMNMYGIAMTINSLFLLIISSFLMAIAWPPVSGAAIAVFSVLLNSLGVPITAIGIITPITIILDFILTGIRCFDIASHSVLSNSKYEKKSKKADLSLT